MKSYTDIEQSKKLAKILPIKSADMGWYYSRNPNAARNQMWIGTKPENADIPCWSLAALMKILHRNEKDIVSLSYGGYKDGEYILKWCLDYEFEDGDYKKTFSDNPIDAAFEMVVWLLKNKKI